MAEVSTQEVARAVEVLRRGGLVAFPTDTVYALGADAFNEEAVQKVYEVKRRPWGLPLPLFLSDRAQMTMIASVVPEVAWRLAVHFLPGGLTLVLPKAKAVPYSVTAGGETVAVRIPDHPIPLNLVRGLGTPVVGTSANVSGRRSLLSAAEVRQELGEHVALIIEGSCPGGQESTVVDVTVEPPRILRQGIVPREQIEVVCSLAP